MDGPTAVIPQAERQQSRRKHAFVPARKLSKAFARSAPQTPAQAASWDNSSSSISTFILSPPHSPTTTISKAERRKSQRVVSPQVVSSILDSMYAYPVNRESNRLSLPKYQDKASLHHKSSLGTGASRISDVSRRSSEKSLHHPSPTIKTKHSTRGHTSSNDFSSNNHEPETSDTRHMGKNSETQPDILQDGGSTVRIVGRGGSGSRLRVVTSTPEALEINPPRHREQPASLSHPTHRGAGGSRSSQKPVKPAPPLLSILRRRKQQPVQGPSSKGKEREHPIFPDLSYQITNESRSTVTTIHFAGETGIPSPSFSLDGSIGHSSPDKISLPLSSSTSTFDSTAEDASLHTRTPSSEDFDLDLYLEESQCPPLEERRKRSMNKLARTLGNFSHNDISPGEMPGKKAFFPNPFIDDEPTKKDQKKVFRRASLSFSGMSSVFVRPSGRRRRDSIKSQHSLSTLTDDLHQLNLVDDFSDSSSACNSPVSPILFSPPSPSSTRPPNAATSNPHGAEVEEESLSVSSSTLSRSHSYSHTPRRRSERLSNHSHSASMSPSSHDHSTTSASSTWIFPPSDHHEEVTFSTANIIAEEPQSWTGEWNSDIDDVIRALRALR